MKELFITEVGSTMWGMANAESDQDLWAVYQMSTAQLLSGLPDSHSEQTGNPGVPGAVDRVSHEFGTVITQLLKNNWNFVVGVLSPIVVKPWDDLDYLRGLTMDCLSTDIYNSSHGLAVHNYNKYIKPVVQVLTEPLEPDIEKRCNTIARTVKMACKILLTGDVEFAPVFRTVPKDIPKLIAELDEARDNSVLPKHPRNEREMRDFLFAVRLEDLYSTIGTGLAAGAE